MAWIINKIYLLLLLLVVTCNGANILAVFYSFSKSHQIFGLGVIKELARRGHQITMVSGFPLNKPMENYTDIFVPEIIPNKEKQQMFDDLMVNSTGVIMTSFDVMSLLDETTKEYTEAIFKNAEFKKFVETQRNNVDLVLVDLFFNHAHLVLGDVFNAPIIPFSSAGFTDFVSELTHNPNIYSYTPNKMILSNDEMSFIERLKNACISTFVSLFFKYSRIGHQAIAKRHFPDSPPLEEIIYTRIPFVFSNAHYSYETSRPYNPNVINIGGSHVEPQKPLPKDIQTILDQSTQGAIFFSLGSNVKSNILKQHTINGLLRAFERSKYTVLMKWESDDLPNKPKNVFISNWLPQNDILAHRNIKAFITHGGLLSTIEAIHHAVPIIGVPIYADQIANVPQAVQAGYGLQLNFYDLNEEDVYNAIMEITSNPRYRENVKKRSDLLRNQPIKPLDLAIYWVEHVLKYKGAPYLQTKAHKLWWFQIYLLDVVGFIFLALISSIMIVFSVIKCGYKIFKKPGKKLLSNKKRN